MIGTDPEFAIRSTSGKFIPAHKVFGDHAHKSVVAPGIVAFRDGFVVELNVPPQETPLALVQQVQRGIWGANRKLPKLWELCTNASFNIDMKDMQSAPEDVKHFGCSPSYCAYSGERKLVKADPMSLKMRCAGAHMHFSATPHELERRFHWLHDRANHELFIKLMDKHVGLPLAAIFHNAAQYERRTLYGQAGEYRPQEYPDGSIGLEYRTPPPQLWNHAEIAILAFSVGLAVFNGFEDLARRYDSSDESRIRHAINTGEGLGFLPMDSGFGEELVHKYSTDPQYRMFKLTQQAL